MGRKAIELGATAAVLATNIARFRGLRGYTLADLSDRMTDVGRPMTGNTISTIENQQRRADVDDLVALAAALDVSPAALLMPYMNPADSPDPGDLSLLYERRVASSADTEPVEAGQLWLWLTAASPLASPQYMDEVDEFAIEHWRREQVPRFAWKASSGG